MASGSAGERAVRVELAELRAQVAERDRLLVLLAEENTVLRRQVGELGEQVAELGRRLGQNPRNSHKPPSSEGYEQAGAEEPTGSRAAPCGWAAGA